MHLIGNECKLGRRLCFHDLNSVMMGIFYFYFYLIIKSATDYGL